VRMKRTVRTLIGHRQVDVGLRCLASLLRLSSEPISLIIHDDGTLTDEDRERLAADLRGSAFVSRKEADAAVQPLLERYPKCRAYRERHPLALKLLDIPLIAPEELAYCDSDVLFLRRFTRMFEWAGDGTSAIFMQDEQEAYSLRPWHIFPFGKIRVPGQINSGLIFYRTSKYDLDFVEWFLGRPELVAVFRKRPHWIEQTCWAALGWRAGCRVWSSAQLMIANPKMSGLSVDTVGIHFVAAYRSKLQEFTKHEADEIGNAVAIQSLSAGRVSLVAMLLDDLRRRL
jgi:hypothetical protein